MIMRGVHHAMTPARRGPAWLFLSLVMAAVPAAAQDLRVRAGEHAGFSRLVFYIGSDSPWQVNRISEGYRLQIRQPGSSGFDVTDVFSMIRRDRVRALEPAGADGQPALDIVLACECHATGFIHAPGILVIDIRDGPAPEDAPFETSFSVAEVPVAQPDTAPVPPGTAVSGQQAPEPGGEQAPRDTEASPRAAAVAMPVPERPVPLLPGAFDAARSEAGVTGAAPGAPDLGPATAFLESEFARARALGLITPSQSALPPARAALAQHADVDAAGNMRSRTANDPARPGGAVEREDRSHCIAPERLDLGTWATGPEPGDDIGSARTRLFGEFDRLDRDAAADLVRAYLHYGFGAEAAQLLALFSAAGGELSDTALLLALARIIDAPRSGLTPPLAGQAGCPGHVALWHLLAQPHDAEPILGSTDADEMSLSFGSLPGHLRRHLDRKSVV